MAFEDCQLSRSRRNVITRVPRRLRWIKNTTQIGLLLILTTYLNLKTVWIVEVNTGLRFPLDLYVTTLQFG
jgi:hypothetical protein